MSHALPTLAEFQQLHQSILAAALDPRRWGQVMGEMSMIGGDGAAHTHLFGFDLRASEMQQISSHGYAPDYLESYIGYYQHLNAWMPGYARAGVGEVVTGDFLLPREALRRTEFYADWLRPQEDIVAGAGAILFRENDRMFVIGGNLRVKDEKRLLRRWVAMLQGVLPTLRHALEINRTLAVTELQRQLAVPSVAAVLALDDTARLRFSNASAQTWIAEGRLWQEDEAGRVSFVDEAAQERLSRMLLGLKGDAARLGDAFEIRTPALRVRCRLAGFVAEVGGCGDGYVRQLLNIPAPVLFVVASPLAHDAGAAALLHEAYGLSGAEADVALRLHAGASLDEVAVARQSSIHTVRAQTKMLFTKCGAHSQRDIILIVERMLTPW
jgi:DNA-binding CsgD family transcriptional regulator